MNLKDMIRISKIAAKDVDVPFYSSYASFEKDKILTCSDGVFSSLNYSPPFEGNVNLFLLEKYVIGIEDPFFIQKSNSVTISGKTKGGLQVDADIPLISLKFPLVEWNSNLTYLSLREDLLAAIKTGARFIGTASSYSGVFITSKGVYSTDRTILYKYSAELDISSPIFVNMRLLPFLQEGMTLASDGSRTYIEHDWGYIVHNLPFLSFDEFPFQSIDFLVENTEKIVKLCNSLPISEACGIMQSSLFKEKRQVCSFLNEDRKLIISSEYAASGGLSIKIDTEVDERIRFSIEVGRIKNIPSSCDFYVLPIVGNRMVLKFMDENTTIAFVGDIE